MIIKRNRIGIIHSFTADVDPAVYNFIEKFRGFGNCLMMGGKRLFQISVSNSKRKMENKYHSTFNLQLLDFELMKFEGD